MFVICLNRIVSYTMCMFTVCLEVKFHVLGVSGSSITAIKGNSKGRHVFFALYKIKCCLLYSKIRVLHSVGIMTLPSRHFARTLLVWLVLRN
jgi:hypothetical protein